MCQQCVTSTAQALEAVGKAVHGACRKMQNMAVMTAALQELSETMCREAQVDMFEVRVWEDGEANLCGVVLLAGWKPSVNSRVNRGCCWRRNTSGPQNLALRWAEPLVVSLS